ncbi:Uncharacterised protein family, glycosyl hydrolase catalytic domain [Lasallia pustulata]|uniref:Uncharacterized protein family, glycosyl hydrolase catalytic domain n=1 Tax=Lasallia pustulata TaxID=136370 RepID=A0A1W5CUU3_9LECA|nr:Uncharacterised protein family, glycosyl hydrolase catalytic domain [Lasallia pustulata]
MSTHKRILLWDWTNTAGPSHPGVPWAMDKVHFNGPLSSVSNWNTWVPPELKNRAPFRPMIHDLGKLSGDDWARINACHDQIILFFNEPERNGISAQQAADIWHKQIVPLRTQKRNKLVSPSCADDEKGQAWIADFMHRVAGAPPDYLGLHYYGTDAQAAIKYLEEMHAKFPHQPVMVSEIASISRDYKQVLEFTVEVANWMDKTGWIFEYGFFGCMRQVADAFVSPAAQLMKPDGEFTDLMYKLMSDQPMHT